MDKKQNKQKKEGESRTIQEDEFEAIKSIYCDELTDLRPQSNEWLPLDFKVELTPQKDSKVSQAFCSITIHIKCGKSYPKTIPTIQLENPKGLKDSDVAKLSSMLNSEAYKCMKKNDVMIYALCTLCQDFLFERNKPPQPVEPVVSFYETMLKNKQIKDQKQQEEQNEIERKLQEKLQSDILKRKEQLMKETRTRRSTVSESSPRHLSSSNSEDAKNYEVCDEHRGSETIVFPSTGRKIQQSACLGHSQKGCINYSGIDLASGKLVYITEWTIKNSQIEAKNLLVDAVIETVEKKISELSKLRHKNIIGYECAMSNRKKDSLQIYLVQEFLLGISLNSISGGLGWCSEGASMIAKGVLHALIFLHNNGVSHGNLLDSTIFMDHSGCIKATDFGLVPYLQELIGVGSSSADLPALGILIESLVPTPTVEMRDFISQCKSERTISASDLLDHQFLYSMLAQQHSRSPDEQKPMPNFPPPAERPHSAINTVVPFIAPALDHSRLKTEFETISFIGQGAYGDVLKVRNMLDNRQYAIKRIPLSAKNKQLYKKMTREVELLSRLNHENVVRYFNSWIETEIATINEDDEDDDSEGSITTKKGSAMVKTRSQNQLAAPSDDDSSDDSSDDSFSPGWNNFIGNPGVNDDSDSDDGIEFANSDGKAPDYEDDENSAEEKKEKGGGDATLVRKKWVLYIQMEYCEKSTLRTAIDGNLYQQEDRLWKLFREIVEGLTHIHNQGMIHRDLKPVNIFLDSKDLVKIGDFGLATTSVLALQNQTDANLSMKPPQLNFGDSQTGQVGTALYVAPELSGKASKSTYNQKVDLYSLGIIFFEMCSPPLNTGMERVKTIAALRQPEVVIPKEMEEDVNHKDKVKLLKWLLDHNPSKRPTSEELLQSELVPAAKLDAYELQEMLRHVLANPQSRNYKHLISRCLAQESDTVCQFTYHMGMVPISSLFENVKNKIVQILRKHGAIDVSTPLLTPFTKTTSSESAVRLMCHSGSVVTLPYDLRQPFLRHVALNGINFLRRYSIGRIYREKKIYNFHPKQNFECAFDIVSPSRGHFLVDAELLAVAHEIINEFETLKQKNISFRISHTSLLRAIFLFYSVPINKYKNLLSLVADYLEGKLSKLIIKDAIKSLLPGKDQMVDMLLMGDCAINAVNSTMLKILIKGRGEAPALAKGAIRELETVINLSQAMGVNIPVNLCIGLSAGYDCTRSGSIMWQMTGELKPGKLTVLACGGRYDNYLEDFRKSAQNAGMAVVNREIYCAGFSLAIDKLVVCLNQIDDVNYHKSIVDLMVYVSGNRPPLKEVTQILKSLWAAGIKCCFIEAPTARDDEDLWAKDLGANHIIMLGEDGCLRVKSWQHDRYCDKNVVTRQEVIEYLKRNLNADVTSIAENLHQTLTIQRNNSVTNIATKNFELTAQGHQLDVIFLYQEKLNLSKRKRIENQIEQKLANVLQKFNRKETFAIFVVDLDLTHVKALVGCIDPNPKTQSRSELDALLEKFPKYKQKYLQGIYDDITDRVAKNKNSGIVGIFSVADSYYRLIL